MRYRTAYGNITVNWTADERERLATVLADRDERRASPLDPGEHQLWERDKRAVLPSVSNGTAVDWRESLRLGPRGATALERLWSDTGDRVWRRDLTVKEDGAFRSDRG